jgi:hypothetical protein
MCIYDFCVSPLSSIGDSLIIYENKDDELPTHVVVRHRQHFETVTQSFWIRAECFDFWFSKHIRSAMVMTSGGTSQRTKSFPVLLKSPLSAAKKGYTMHFSNATDVSTWQFRLESFVSSPPFLPFIPHQLSVILQRAAQLSHHPAVAARKHRKQHQRQQPGRGKYWQQGK